MYQGLLHTHNSLRWIIVILMLIAILRSGSRLSKGMDKQAFKIALFALIALHVQLILGLAIYFMSPVVETALSSDGMMKSGVLRFWAIEHMVGMILGIMIVTIGYSKAKRASSDIARAKKVFWFYLIGFIIILSTIPWPFRAAGIARDWFPG